MTSRLAIGISALALALSAIPASAHAFLVHANPPAGATVSGPLAQVLLEYSEKLEPSFSTVTVVDGGGNAVNAAPPQFNGAVISVALKPLLPGTYEVKWRVLSVDTHVTQGAYKFTIVAH